MWRVNNHNATASSSLLLSAPKIHTPFASKTTSLPSSTPPLCFSSSLTSSSISNKQMKHLFYYPKSALVGNCSFNQGAAASDDTPNFPPDQPPRGQQSDGFWSKWKSNTGEMSAKLTKLGLAALLAYGLFDAVIYTTFFVLAFHGYEKSTGKNPAANLQALLGIVILMWTGNNITRPFRVAGAAALAPFIDSALKKIQNYFKFPRLVYAFALVVSAAAGTCLTVVGLLILSRWGK